MRNALFLALVCLLVLPQNAFAQWGNYGAAIAPPRYQAVYGLNGSVIGIAPNTYGYGAGFSIQSFGPRYNFSYYNYGNGR